MTPNEKRKCDDRDGVRMAGMLLILAAEEGDASDVVRAMKAIDPFALAPLAEKFAVPIPEQDKIVARVPFARFESDCFLHGVDPKSCTCYKHRDNPTGKAMCSEQKCPLYGKDGK